MVPRDLIGYFTASSAVAGSLIGLLFVSISLRYDGIFGSSADVRSRAIAGAAFTALANALTISLWALIPNKSLGYPAVIAALFCLVSTLRLHVRQLGRAASVLGSFVLSIAVYISMLAEGAFLIARPQSTAMVFALAYTIFGGFASALSRSWQLLQPAGGDRQAIAVAPTGEAASPPSPPS